MTLKHLQHEAHKIRMTPAEKAAMRASIFGTPSPLVPSRNEGYFFFDFQFMSRAFAAALVVLVVGGSGVAYAAEGALPGQPLYAVKIHVNEPVEVALATTPQQKVAVETRLAARRVAEAQTLEAQGRLDATTTQEIEDNFNEHASRALALAGGAPNVAMTSFMRAADTEDSGAAASSSEVAEAPRVAMTAAKLRPKATAPTMMMATEMHEDMATTTPPAQSEATSSEQAGGQHEGEDVSASIDAQRQILKEIRQRVESRHGEDNENRRGQDGSGDSNSDSGGDH